MSVVLIVNDSEANSRLRTGLAYVRVCARVFYTPEGEDRDHWMREGGNHKG